MFAKLDEIESRFEELAATLADPQVAGDPARYQKHARAYAELQDIVTTYRQYRRVRQELEQARELARSSDADMAGLARTEVELLASQEADLQERLRTALVPRDPNDEKNVVLEVRAGTGGDEASLFAGEVWRMYSRYAESRGWRVDITDLHASDAGGLKEVVAVIEGRGAYSRLKYESGVHRVQRVPVTEGSGRIHTSAVTVAVLPEAEEVDLQIDEKDLRIDTYRSSGAGGQHVNVTDSAVRITHEPTGLVVSCQDEKSQHKNRDKAMRVLRARLMERHRQEQHQAEAAVRRSQVGSGDRSEKIRTYNFPQNRITDHRIGLTTHRLQDTLDGALDPIIDPLAAHFQALALQGRTTPDA